MLARFLALSLVVCISGCATVFTGTTQSIHVDAQDATTHKPLSDTDCSIMAPTGASYHLASNPGTVLVAKGKEPLRVICRRAGYANYENAITSHFNAVTLLDIFFWPTFFVDLGTGAMNSYPAHYTVAMDKKD